MAEQKTYINGLTVKQVDFKDGGNILKVGVNVAKLIEQLQQNTNEKGYVNLAISKRKEPGKYGETHCVWLDTWKPTQREGQSAPVAAKPAAMGCHGGGTVNEDSGTLPF